MEEGREKNEHRRELCRKTNSHALKHFEIFERHRTPDYRIRLRAGSFSGSTGRAASSLRSGCLIQTNYLSILIYVCRLCPGPRLKKTFALLKATLTHLPESRLSFQSDAQEESQHFLRGRDFGETQAVQVKPWDGRKVSNANRISNLLILDFSDTTRRLFCRARLQQSPSSRET